MKNRNLVFILFISILIMYSPSAFTGQLVNIDSSGTAIKGYDPVAYFVNGMPVKGKKDISFEWRGAAWLFSSENNKKLFQDNPEKYAPRYGGFCSYAVAHNYTASIDPFAWTIVDGRLYLNYSKSVQSKWKSSMKEYIKRADKNWPALNH